MTVEAVKKPLANVITLGVRDLEAQRAFYRRVGWETTFETDDYAAFELQGTVLALFPIEKLAADGGADADPPGHGIRFSIGVMTESPDDVDALIDRVRAAGGRVTKDPVAAEYFEGRSAYFADPEGNYWEVVWAPGDNPIVAAARRRCCDHAGDPLKNAAEPGWGCCDGSACAVVRMGARDCVCPPGADQ